MHKFLCTKHIFGFGPAFVAIAAEELQKPSRFRADAFVTFPKTAHPARVAVVRCKYIVPSDPVESLDALLPDVTAMLEEAEFRARQLLHQYQEIACKKSHDASWLDDLVLDEIDDENVRRMWIRNCHRKAFKFILRQARVESLIRAVNALQGLRLIVRDEG